MRRRDFGALDLVSLEVAAVTEASQLVRDIRDLLVRARANYRALVSTGAAAEEVAEARGVILDATELLEHAEAQARELAELSQ